jgi:hypothetical protein
MSDTRLTRALWIAARYRDGAFEGEASLLVYDEDAVEDALISTDIRTVFERRPHTAKIFILAPHVPNAEVRAELSQGSAVRRAMPYLRGQDSNLRLIQIERTTTSGILLNHTGVTLEGDIVHFSPTTEPLPAELASGWLFELFDRHQGLVVAPEGVHFTKSSGRHSRTFLRTANVLLSSAACSLLGLLALVHVLTQSPKRLLVDTAPLISVAYAMTRIAKRHGIWQGEPSIRSFSSYGGLDGIGRVSTNDVVLISASTSGGLLGQVVARGAQASNVVTLFGLRGADDRSAFGSLLSDLTHRMGLQYGYSPVPSYVASECPYCKVGWIAAELEGDQFLLQRRQHKLIEITKDCQSNGAREAIHELAKHRIFRIQLHLDSGPRPALDAETSALLGHGEVRARLVRHVRRFCPTPLDLVVLTGVNAAEGRQLLVDSGLEQFVHTARFVDPSSLRSIAPIEGGSALCLFGVLSDYALARSINASLRSIVPTGNVTYLAALTLFDSEARFKDLERFLVWGERGADTFTFRSASRLSVPFLSDAITAWDKELHLLAELAEMAALPTGLAQRKAALEACTCNVDDLFWSSSRPRLAIQNDFVYLDTRAKKDVITQADIYATLGGVLSAARERSLQQPSIGGASGAGNRPALLQSVYGHVLLAPRNFRLYNDAVLRGALLRLATASELNYAVDAECSEDVGQVIEAEIDAWASGGGDALPEMLIALATGRLALDHRWTVKIKQRLEGSRLEDDLRVLAARVGLSNG